MIVYLITNKIDGKKWVGQTINTLEERWRQHQQKNSSCRYLRNAIQKYGPENFERKVLARCNTIEEMNHREDYYISLFDTMVPNGYNLIRGGNNKKPSQETRDKRSASMMGLKRGPRDAEYRRKLGLARLGTKQSQKEKDKRAKSLFQPVMVPELNIVFESYGHASKALGTHNHVIRSVMGKKKENWKGLTFVEVEKDLIKPPSQESLALLEEFLKNKKNGWIGKKRSTEENERNRIRQQKSIFCPELNKTFVSIKKAAQELGLQEAGVGRVARGEMKQTGGYTFIFSKVNNDETTP